MKIWKIGKYWILGLLKLEYEVNDKYTYSPPPQLGASDPLSRLTAGLCVYFFYPDLFPSEINIISPPPPKKNTQTAPLIADKALTVQL